MGPSEVIGLFGALTGHESPGGNDNDFCVENGEDVVEAACMGQPGWVHIRLRSRRKTQVNLLEEWYSSWEVHGVQPGPERRLVLPRTNPCIVRED